MNKKELLPLQIECTMLFQSNPLMAANMGELQHKLGRKQEDIKPVLELLVSQGIIEQSGELSDPVFRYQEPVTIMEIGKKDELGKA